MFEEEAARAAGLGPAAVVAAIEHPSVLGVYARLEALGRSRVTLVPAEADGRVRPADLLARVEPETRAVSLMLANNETGAVQEVRVVGDAVRRLRAERPHGDPLLFHVDCVQALGKLGVSPAELGADLVTLSSHKVGGPPGAGALWIRAGSSYRSPAAGGPQERGLRPGTENVPAIAGFVRAAEVAALEVAALDVAALEAAGQRPGSGASLGARLRDLILERVPGAALNGDPEHTLANTVNVSFPGIPAELMVIRLDQEGLAASTGSACASGAREPSHVLRAMGLAGERVESAVRFSTGWTTTGEEVEAAARVIARAAESLRGSRAPGGASP
jgi:cysteine desulfurase